MKHWPLFVMIPALVLVPAADFSSSADSNSCAICHTDAARLKSLVKPPQLGGEGEG